MRRRYPGAGVATYAAVHRQLAAERGAAAEQTCAECAAPATDWSYDNADPRELTDRVTGCAYSLDLSHYRPRCRSCHRTIDWARRREGRPPLDPEECVALYRDGLGIAALARMFDYNPRDVRKVLLDAGEQLRARSAPIGRQGRGAETC